LAYLIKREIFIIKEKEIELRGTRNFSFNVKSRYLLCSEGTGEKEVALGGP